MDDARITALENKLAEAMVRMANMPVRLPAPSISRLFIRGKLNASLTRGSLSAPTTAAMSIWAPGAELSDAWSDTGKDVDVVDTGMIPSSKSPIASGTQVDAAWIGGKWCLISADVC